MSNDPANPVLAFSTCPNAATAERIAQCLVQERLATCVNRLPGLKSTYFWDGRLQDDEEVLLLIKTSDRHLEALGRRLKELHPYELPELVAIPVCGGSADYLTWVLQGVAW